MYHSTYPHGHRLDDRLEIRLWSGSRPRIEAAARLRGVPVAQFVRDAAIEAARRELAAQGEQDGP